MKLERKIWVDRVKIFACILVVMGHFFQGIIKSGIIQENLMYNWFNNTIYYFHVQLFFVCSGYLFQENNRINSISSWRINCRKKLIVLGIPYVCFTVLAWGLKFIFSASVNTGMDNIGIVLFVKPTAPYWFLFCLFFIFFITPTISDKNKYIIGVVAIVLKFATFLWTCPIYAVSSVMTYEIWFVIGMYISKLQLEIICKKTKYLVMSVLGICIFTIMSIVISNSEVNIRIINFLMGVLSVFSIVLLFINADFKDSKFEKKMSLSIMPIYLMHTIFAAMYRSVLIKFDIKYAMIHIIGGVIIGFVGPVIADKFKIIHYIIFPNKFVYRGKND